MKLNPRGRRRKLTHNSCWAEGSLNDEECRDGRDLRGMFAA